MRLITPVVLLLLLAGAGCSTQPAAPTPAPTVTVTATAMATATITASATPSPEVRSNDEVTPASLTDLRDQLSKKGLTCDDWSATIKNAAGSCDDLILLMYDDGTSKSSKLFQLSLSAAWGAVRDQNREDEIAFLVGKNWFARVALADAETLRDDLGSGGVILH